MTGRDYGGDDDDKPDAKEGMHYEFDCPECNANNPYHEGFKVGSEVLCFYCGNSFKVVQGEGRVRFKPA